MGGREAALCEDAFSGSPHSSTFVCHLPTPTPYPSPQGGGDIAQEFLVPPPAPDLLEVRSSRLWAFFHFNFTRFLFPLRMAADRLGVTTSDVKFWLTPWQRTDEHLPLSPRSPTPAASSGTRSRSKARAAPIRCGSPACRNPPRAISSTTSASGSTKSRRKSRRSRGGKVSCPAQSMTRKSMPFRKGPCSNKSESGISIQRKITPLYETPKFRSGCTPLKIWPCRQGSPPGPCSLGFGPAAQRRFHCPIALRNRSRALLPRLRRRASD